MNTDIEALLNVLEDNKTILKDNEYKRSIESLMKLNKIVNKKDAIRVVIRNYDNENEERINTLILFILFFSSFLINIFLIIYNGIQQIYCHTV